MVQVNWKVRCVLAAILILGKTQTQLLVASPSPNTKYVDPLSREDERQRLLRDLVSSDPATVDAAVQEVHDAAIKKWHTWPNDLNLFIKVGRYDDLERSAIDGILINRTSNEALAGFEKMRVKAFLAANQPDKALACAKAYFNLASLKQTADAIITIHDVLSAIDSQKADQFNTEQATSLKNPTTQPAKGQITILASIQIKDSRLLDALNNTHLLDYDHYMRKGNLLLALGRSDEALDVFIQAIKFASVKDLGHATENIARAARAESGLAGAANA